MYRNSSLQLLALVLSIFCIASGLRGQNITGSILGQVQDSSAAVLPNVEVEVLNLETNQAVRVKTNANGVFEANYLRPGGYRVTVVANGFKKSVRDGLTVQIESRLRVDFQLEVGDSQATIQVTSEAPLVESENASLGQVVSSRSLQELPIRGRNIFDLIGLSAGVQVNPRSLGGTASTGDNSAPLFAQSDISINGGRFRTNEFLVDGVSIMLPENNNFAFSPSPDGTQEFKVLTNTFGPQYGRSGGGVINVATRAGANEYHGTVYEFFRNDRLRANNFFSNARGQKRGVFHYNQFGAAGGGRIIKDKTFFFAEYTGHREDIAGAPGILTVPTDAQRRGDFSQTRNRQGDPVTIYNPFSTRPVSGGFVRDSYPGNVIPASAQSRVALNLLKFMPVGNRAGEGPAIINNYVWAANQAINSNQWTARIDHRLSDKHSIFGRVSRNTGDNGNNGPYGNIADSVLGVTVNRVWNGVINMTSVLSPTRILNLRLGATRRFEGRIPLADGKVSLAELGFAANVASGAQDQIFPTVGIANYAQLGPPVGDRIRRGNEVYTLVGEQTEIRGRHTIVYGGDVRLYNQTPFQGGASAGSYSFGLGQTQGPDPLRATLTAGDGLASLLTGFGSGSIQRVPALAIRNMYYAFFVNDDIKFKRLTINVGVRYEYDQPRTERYNRFANFDSTAPYPVAVPGLPDLKGTLKFAGQNNVPRGQYEGAPLNFGPRVGLAYRLSNKAVLRAGYGIFYAPRFGTTSGAGFGTPGSDVTTPWVSSLDGVTPLTTIDNPYPNGIFIPPASLADRLQTGLGVVIMDRGNKSNNYNQQWNFTLQNQIWGGLLIEASYAGNRGVRIPIGLDFNQINPIYQSLGARLNTQVANPFFGLTNTGVLAQRTVAQSQLLRPYPQYGSVSTNNPAVSQNMGSSTYHALQMRVEKRFARGYNFLATYTKSKLIDNGSGRIFGESAFVPPVQNVYNLAAERGLSEGDVSQRLVLSHTVELPFGKGRRYLASAPAAAQILAGGWSLVGAATFTTGFPLALTSTGNSGVGGGVLRPNSTGRSAELEGTVQSRLNRFFDTSQFTVPEPFTFGNVSRTLPDVRGPGRRSYDLALQKNFLIREPFSLLFRAEAFNLSNTPYFFRPGQGLGTATFGVINAATGERQVQFSLKVLF